MSRSYWPCFYCKDDMWDDAHWYFFGDNGMCVPYPKDMCGREFKETVPKRYRKMMEKLVRVAYEEGEYERIRRA